MAANNIQTINPQRDWQAEFLTQVLPVIHGIARKKFNGLPDVEREEATAEAVALALVFYARLVERGSNPATFAGRLATIAVLRVQTGRVASTPDRSEDVLSRLARQQRGFTVESLNTCQQSRSGQWQEIVVEDRKSTPADLAACKIDFGEWLNRMSDRRRQIAEALAAGYRTEEVAEQFGLTPGRISQLRRAFEASWNEFQSDAALQA